MKIVLRTICFVIAMFWTFVSFAADPAAQFREKVSALHGMSADFTQHVFDADGDDNIRYRLL